MLLGSLQLAQRRMSSLASAVFASHAEVSPDCFAAYPEVHVQVSA